MHLYLRKVSRLLLLLVIATATFQACTEKEPIAPHATPDTNFASAKVRPDAANMSIYYGFKTYLYDFMYSTNSNEIISAGYQHRGIAFRLWSYHPTPTSDYRAVYRVLGTNGKHFLTTDPTGEGTGQVESIIGYIAKRPLVGVGAIRRIERYYAPGSSDYQYYGDDARIHTGLNNEGILGYTTY